MLETISLLKIGLDAVPACRESSWLCSGDPLELKEITNHKSGASGVEGPNNPERMYRDPLPQAGDALVFDC
jgi:hypothetical protein